MTPYVDEYKKLLDCDRYSVVALVAQRARQINDGVEVYVKSSSKSPVAIALEEVKQGYVKLSIENEGEDVEELPGGKK